MFENPFYVFNMIMERSCENILNIELNFTLSIS